MNNYLSTFNYKNIKIAFSDSGKGKAIVLLHGFLENQLMWQDLSFDLQKKYRIITIDLLGHGQTECLGYVHSMEENAQLVQSVLFNLKIRKAIFVGHSMGGYVALAFAELYPNYLKGLVLLNSTAIADSEEKKINRDRAIVAVKKDYTTFIRLSIANLFSEENREKLISEIEKVKNEALKTPLQGVVAASEGMKIRKDRAFILKQSNFPKLLILGQKDPVLIYENAIEQLEKTNVKLVTLPAGHMSHIENKSEVLKAFLDFFKIC